MLEEPLALEDARDRLAAVLKERATTLVFAESCTGGLCAATLAQVDGISRHLCGSAVTYRPEVKHAWLGVGTATMERFTCESLAVAEEMARGVLHKTESATWSAAIVGDLADGKEPRVYVAIVGRVGSGIEDHLGASRLLAGRTRMERQREAAALVLEWLWRVISRAEAV